MYIFKETLNVKNFLYLASIRQNYPTKSFCHVGLLDKCVQIILNIFCLLAFVSIF